MEDAKAAKSDVALFSAERKYRLGMALKFAAAVA